MIDTQPLAILREVDRTGSLTKAADRLCLTQSAVSHAIKRFEDRHGVVLFERQGRGVRLTEAGHFLLSVARRTLPQLEHAEAALADFARGRRGSLRIGMECHPCQQWLMGVVQPFLGAWPDVDLDVTTAFQFGGLQALLGHEIDVLITPDPIERRGLEYVPVFDYELVLAVAAEHRLAKQDAVSPGDLTGEVLVTYPVDRDRLDVFSQFLAPGGALPRRHRTVETTDLMISLVATGRAVSAMPDWLLTGVEGIMPLRIGQGISKSIHLGMRTGVLSDYLQGFIALAQATPVHPPQPQRGEIGIAS